MHQAKRMAAAVEHRKFLIHVSRSRVILKLQYEREKKAVYDEECRVLTDLWEELSSVDIADPLPPQQAPVPPGKTYVLSAFHPAPKKALPPPTRKATFLSDTAAMDLDDVVVSMEG